MNKAVFDNRIERIHSIISPKEMIEKISADDDCYSFILQERKIISDIINRKSEKFLLIVGPCSIHDTEAAIEYAEKLSLIRKKYADKFCIIMRAYFEKPRTALGWRGLIIEPELNGFINIASGIEQARKLLIKFAELKLPAAVELLDPIIPQYLSDLVCWASVGARSAESQIHREIASALSMPVGFKNTTDGDINSAINGVIVSREPHAFISVEQNGLSAIVHTSGNPDSHLILRGGHTKKNCDLQSVLNAIDALKKKNTCSSLLIDCSHGNSQKDPSKQIENFYNAIKMRFDKDKPVNNIRGCMLESFLQSGSCLIEDCRKKENYGKSITDSCIGWSETEAAIEKAYRFI